ncbi:MAG: hypothetical protein ACPL28_10345 [bacterium]
MTYKHKTLAQGRWFQLTLIEQLSNIGSEVERVIRWRQKNQKYSIEAIERALELIDLTVADVKNRKRLKELLRLREALVDYFYFDNQYGSSDKLWHNYFYPFFYSARKER